MSWGFVFGKAETPPFTQLGQRLAGKPMVGQRRITSFSSLLKLPSLSYEHLFQALTGLVIGAREDRQGSEKVIWFGALLWMVNVQH